MITIARSLVIAAALSASLNFAGARANATDVQSAIAEFNAMHHAKAKEMFTGLLKEDKHMNVANYYLGRIALGDGRYTEATEYLEASIAIEPNSADELYWLASTCYARLGRPSEAQHMGLFICYQQNLEQALSIDPNHLPTLMVLHQFNATGPAIAGASPERAEELLAKIARHSKADADVARLLVFNNKKETAKALSLAQSMIAAYSNSERAMLEAGRVLSSNRKNAEALAAFSKATANKVTMDNRQWIQAAYLEIGHIAWRTQSNLDQGIAALSKVTDTNVFPVNINTNWAHVRLAQLYALKGDLGRKNKHLGLVDKTGVEKGEFLLRELEKVANP